MLNLYSYIDGVMLGVVRGDAETGVYSAAYKVYEGFSYAPSVLAALSLPDRPYPVQSGDVGRLGVLVAATPWNLARRMHHLDRQLAGTRRIEQVQPQGGLNQNCS